VRKSALEAGLADDPGRPGDRSGARQPRREDHGHDPVGDTGIVADVLKLLGAI
jgi:hypothetical protein